MTETIIEVINALRESAQSIIDSNEVINIDEWKLYIDQLNSMEANNIYAILPNRPVQLSVINKKNTS